VEATRYQPGRLKTPITGLHAVRCNQSSLSYERRRWAPHSGMTRPQIRYI